MLLVSRGGFFGSFVVFFAKRKKKIVQNLLKSVAFGKTVTVSKVYVEPYSKKEEDGTKYYLSLVDGGKIPFDYEKRLSETDDKKPHVAKEFRLVFGKTKKMTRADYVEEIVAYI